MIKKHTAILIVSIILSSGTAFAEDRTTFNFPAERTQTSQQRSGGAGNSLTISALPAYNQLRYGINDIRSSGGLDFGFGLTYRRRIFNDNWQLAIGVNYRNYRGSIELNNVRDSMPSGEYFLRITLNSTETQTVTYIEPNIRLEYVRPLNPLIDFIGGIGLGFGFHISETNRMIGKYNLFAHHPETGWRPLGDTYTDFLNPLDGNIFGHSLFALGQVGFRFNLSPRWQLLTMLNIQHSFLNPQTWEMNLQTEQAKQNDFIRLDSYLGVAASRAPGSIHAFSAGLEIGIAWKFGRQRTNAMWHCP